ncbi:hypothetical protein Y032_0119g826 [Ancylostoma ceylanicum]|uniref:Uncharacterized protein n=1 Tax=Ancylostoma ceylanicum TaxID=53326 RepID=A0A016TB59_9BILA|nr:hypothetical protein Y032_0119g826 [Ancylostoma ceylanicum]
MYIEIHCNKQPTLSLSNTLQFFFPDFTHLHNYYITSCSAPITDDPVYTAGKPCKECSAIQKKCDNTLGGGLCV